MKLETSFDKILKQHTAILGKTGSGKTSTAKLLVEHVVAQNARVCILDPIKSDWWGLTSSASGKKAGLPFQILGGPRGHLPLNASAGKVLGELVGKGKLRLSIFDMADFKAGGLQQFFIDFAESLFKHQRGVTYLVCEEAHEFAPKEKSGIGNESMAVFWAKRLATGSRSKGIRLILPTQRAQALHNALLGSCDTLIAHRLTLPADQAPAEDWLKKNVTKDVFEKVTSSFAQLPTGTAWICSGEAKIFEQVPFPRIKTYDNSATPTGDQEHDVKTATVDQDELRQIIGDAVKQLEDEDPKALRKKLSTAEGELAKLRAAPAPKQDPKAIREAEQKLAQAKREHASEVKTLRAAVEAAMKILVQIDASNFFKAGGEAVDQQAVEAAIAEAVKSVTSSVERKLEKRNSEVDKLSKDAKKIVERLKALLSEDVTVSVGVSHNEPFTIQPASAAPAPRGPAPRAPADADTDSALSPGEKAVLIAAVQFGTVDRDQLSVLTGYKRSTRNTYIQRLQQKGLIVASGESITATDAAPDALGSDYEPLPTGRALQDFWRAKLGDGGEKKIFEVLVEKYPAFIDREELSELTSYTRSSRNTYLQRLGARRLIETQGSSVRAAENLF